MIIKLYIMFYTIVINEFKRNIHEQTILRVIFYLFDSLIFLPTSRMI